MRPERALYVQSIARMKKKYFTNDQTCAIHHVAIERAGFGFRGES